MVYHTDIPVAGAATDIEAGAATDIEEAPAVNTSFFIIIFFIIIKDNFKQAVDLLHQRVVLPVGHKLHQTVALLRHHVELPVGRICRNVGRSVFGEEAVVIMPKSTLTFTVTALLALTQIKSQGNAGFPFSTHPRAIMVAVSGVVSYGFASAAELVILAQGYDHTSVSVVIAKFGRMASMAVLVTSLASLFYF